WNVSDREAHAWVEVWFKGYGWLPFDPTPTGPGAPPRGAAAPGTPVGLGARGLAPSQAAQAGTTRGASAFEQKLNGNNGFGPHGERRDGSSAQAVNAKGGSGDRGRPALLLLAALAAAGGGIVLTKAGVRV